MSDSVGQASLALAPEFGTRNPGILRSAAFVFLRARATTAGVCFSLVGHPAAVVETLRLPMNDCCPAFKRSAYH